MELNLKNLRISELIRILQKVQKKFGDLEIIGQVNEYDEFSCRFKLEVFEILENLIIENTPNLDDIKKEYLIFNFQEPYILSEN